MTTPDITKASPIFANIQGMFSEAGWTQVLRLVNASATLRAELNAFEADIAGGAANPLALSIPDTADPGAANAARFNTLAGKSTISMGTTWFASPETFVGGLAHELGHYVNRGSDAASWTSAESGGSASALQIVCLDREGWALENNINVAAEIQGKLGVRVAIPGERSGNDLIALRDSLRASYLSYGATPTEATDAVRMALAVYNMKNGISGMAPGSTYWDWCLNEARKRPTIVRPAPYMSTIANAYSSTSLITVDGISSFTFEGVNGRLSFSMTDIGVFPLSDGLQLPDAEGQPIEGADLDYFTLVSAIKVSPKFKVMVDSAPFVLDMLFDRSLYAADPASSSQRSLLARLYAAQSGDPDAGVPGIPVLDRFANDVLKLVGDTGLVPTHLQKQLATVAIEYYTATAPASTTNIFDVSGGGIHFKYSDIGGGTTTSHSELVAAVMSLLTPTEGRYASRLSTQDAWHVQQGEAALLWTGSSSEAVRDAAIGGDGNDSLNGGAGQTY